MLIDRMLSAIAPSIAADRAQARLRTAQAEAQQRLLQGYDAAAGGGRHAGWRRPLTSAAAEMQPAMQLLRGGARDLVRNNPHAARAVRVIAGHVAGTGVRPRAEATTDEGVAKVARDQWARFAANCDPEGMLDWYGQQRLLMRTVVETGEALRVWFPIRDRGRMFWRCRILEGDHLDHQRNEALADGNRVVQGVEFDRLGRRVAYWLHETHPGDRFSIASRSDVRRVPAAYVDHAFEVLRPGQVRGVSWFSPVAVTLRDLDELAEAALVKKKMEACMGIILVNPEGDGLPAAGTAGLVDAKDDAGGQLTTSDGAAVEGMRPGMVVTATQGWDAKFPQPTSSPDLVEHMKERLHAVAAGIGISYAQLTGDLSTANYSSMRAGQLEWHTMLDTWQADLMVHQTGRPAWRRVMDAAVVNGELDARPRAKWTPPRRPWVDPQKDMNAMLDGARAGVASPYEIIERHGDDPSEVLAEIARWQRETEGLSLSIDYTQEGGGDAP